MNNDVKFFTNSEHSTEQIAFDLAQKIEFGSVIALIGNLGTGKTVFARGFAKGLGIKDIVCSPTFNIVREYPCKNSNWLYHMDLYRINDSEAALAFGIEEYINNPKSITLIEWSERISDILPADMISVEIKRLNDTDREIIITRHTA